MTNKKRANKLAKITVASAIALSALAQPLGNVITVKATEAPVTTKAESKLLQSTALKTSVPVTLKNTQFTSTNTSIPNWEIAPQGDLFATPYGIGTKRSDGTFKVDGLDVTVKPSGSGSIQIKIPLKKNWDEYVIRQTIDTIPGVKYSLSWTEKGISGEVAGTILGSSRFHVQGMDESEPYNSTYHLIFSETGRNQTMLFTAKSEKTAIALTMGCYMSEITESPVAEFSNLSLTASATESIATPTIDTVTDNDTVVTGTGEVGQNVSVALPDGSFKTGIVDEDGKYSITIPKQAKDKVIKVMLYDGQGNISPEASTTVISDVVAPPTVNAVTSDDTTVKGTGVNGATVTLTIGNATYTGTVSGGEYSITIPKQSAGTVISAKESLNGKTSTSVSTTVTQGTVVAPTINTVTSDDITVTGTGIKGAVVTLTIAGHNYTGIVDANGAYSITIVKQPVGTTITAKQEINSKSSVNATTTVTQGTVAAPTINTVTTDDTTVTGTGVKGAVVKLTIGGTNYTGLVDNDGKYSIVIPKQAFGTAIVANQTLNTKTSTNTVVSVTQGTVAAPTISAVTTDDTTVKGTGITGAVVTITIGSNTYTGAVTGGNYSITIPKQAAGTVISAKQTVNSKASASVTTTVVSTQTTLTTNDFTIGADNYIRGTYTGSSVTKLAIEVNGVVQQKITATGSPYQYYAKGKVTAGTDQVYVISYNASGVQLKRVKVNVKTLTSGTITPATFYVGTDNYVTGTLTGDVSKFSLTINGVETAKINVTTAPTFRYYANNLIRNLTDVVTVNGYDSAGKLLDSTTLTVDKQRGNQGSIATVAPFTLGKDSYVTGTYTGDIAKVELQVNDTTLQRITVSADGTIKYYAKGKINALTDVVKLIGYDSTGVAVSTKVVSVTGANGSITVDPYVIGTDSYVKGTFSGNVAKVSLTVNGEKKTTIPVPASGANYQYYAKSLITEATDVVVVTAYNSAGGVLDTKAVSVSKR
ncbi:immunoglobulin-like domain-containing protein [Listeria booriae]|uniref:Bacterial Ig domain-containing protein n=1 Tax=Listeria booriae TaxID=1552123 RepID=A0A7X1DJW5_9LIST|nr:immunoglobulin-like domain-containing protein [Listeria booriae]MBC2310497.1 hypothetical protein [Listeria booriae]